MLGRQKIKGRDMSNELKRTVLAGALIAGILFVAQMFGVFGVPEDVSSVPGSQAVNDEESS